MAYITDKNIKYRNPTIHGLMKMAFVVFLSLSASSAYAQDESNLVESAELVTDADFETENISGRVWIANIQTCRALMADNEELTFEWILKSAYESPDSRYAIKIERPEGTCDTTSAGQENGTDCVYLQSNQRVEGDVEFRQKVRPGRIFDFTGPDDCYTEIDGAYNVMMILPRVNIGTDDEESHEPDTVRVRLDTERPAPPPGAITVSGGERRLSVSWEEATESDEYTIYASTSPLTAGEMPEVLTGVQTATVSGTSGSITSGITANQMYYVAVSSVDASGNRSVLSEVSTVITQPTTDFWEDYQGRGGQEKGGYCMQVRQSPGLAGMILWGCMGALMIFVRRREDR